ncbi:MAG: type 1 glutamine amidotransferase [Sneathiella sp.]|nr:type 1 glutamine amidotransferase [Sneathiella sp.]
MKSISLNRIGILQTGIVGAPLAEIHGEYPDMFQDMLGQDAFEYVTYPVVEGVFPEAPSECDGWIITGSKHGAYETHDWIPPLEDFIRKLVAARIPTVGICFGHQIMAQALGGTVKKSPKGWGVGLQEYKDLKSGRVIRIRAFHQDQVIKCPPSATVTHTSEFCEFAGLQYSPNCVSLQPHPEHSAAFTSDLIEVRRNVALPDTVADAAQSVNNNPDDHAEYSIIIKRILSAQSP